MSTVNNTSRFTLSLIIVLHGSGITILMMWLVIVFFQKTPSHLHCPKIIMDFPMVCPWFLLHTYTQCTELGLTVCMRWAALLPFCLPTVLGPLKYNLPPWARSPLPDISISLSNSSFPFQSVPYVASLFPLLCLSSLTPFSLSSTLSLSSLPVSPHTCVPYLLSVA